MTVLAKLSVRVAAIDPQPMYRAGVAHVLGKQPRMHLAGEGGTAAQAVALARTQALDVMIIDISVDAGLGVLAEIRATCPQLALIVLGGSVDADGVAEAIRSGVKGCVPRGTDGAGLVEAINRVMKGELYVAPSMGWHLLSRLTALRSGAAVGLPPAINFTSREEEIMLLVASGATNKEVALDLEVSVKTVKHHLTNVMQKLRVRNRVEAVLAYRARSGAAMPVARQRAAAY